MPILDRAIMYDYVPDRVPDEITYRTNRLFYNGQSHKFRSLDSFEYNGLTLSRQDEVDLFLRFNYAKYMAAKLHKMHLKDFTGDWTGTESRRVAEIKRWLGRAAYYKDIIARHNEALVTSIVKKCRNCCEYNDLISIGNMALNRCIEKFDVKYGCKFSTLVTISIERAIYQYLRRQNRHPTCEYPEYELRDDEEAVRLTQVEAKFDINALIFENKAKLSCKERKVVIYNYGLGDKPRMTLDELGAGLGVSRERVRQIRTRAIKKLREYIDEPITN